MRHAGESQCGRHLLRVLEIPGNRFVVVGLISFFSLPCVFLLLSLCAPCPPGVFRLYVTIERLLQCLKQFLLDHQISRGKPVLMASLNWTVCLRALWASGYCKGTSMSVRTNLNPSDVLIHNNAIFLMQCRCSLQPAHLHASATVSWRVLLPYKVADVCKGFAQKSRSIVGQLEGKYLTWLFLFVRQYCRYMRVEFILAVWIARDNCETGLLFWRKIDFRSWSSVVPLTGRQALTQRIH